MDSSIQLFFDRLATETHKIILAVVFENNSVSIADFYSDNIRNSLYREDDIRI
jgi:hypothetical protein